VLPRPLPGHRAQLTGVATVRAARSSTMTMKIGKPVPLLLLLRRLRLLLLLCAPPSPASALDNGLALVPQMGYVASCAARAEGRGVSMCLFPDAVDSVRAKSDRYNSWYDLTCSAAMNETTLRASVDKMVALGLPKLGYQYFNLVRGPFGLRSTDVTPVRVKKLRMETPGQDDCYVHSRLPNGTLIPDPVKFPNGMRALAD
jgi:hypothetical protein